jgi:hypothetical protein
MQLAVRTAVAGIFLVNCGGTGVNEPEPKAFNVALFSGKSHFEDSPPGRAYFGSAL